MVGGKVSEICCHPTIPDRYWVNAMNRPYKEVEYCAIYVVKNADSDKIEIGDSIWWQGGYAYWTPQNSNREKCGVDYDIKIPRIGFSGVSNPWLSREG